MNVKTEGRREYKSKEINMAGEIMKKLKSKKYNFVIIFDSLNVCNDEYVLRYKSRMTGDIKEFRYNSFEEFKEEWEEYTPKSAMICGIREIEIFKEWAKYTGNEKFLYDKQKDCLIANFKDDNEKYKMYFSFESIRACQYLIDNTVYSLNELIGEDED